VSVPDPRKGERIVLVSTQTDATREAYRKALRKAGGSELMAPAEIVSVEDMPVLGTGKTDYAAVQRLARASLGLADAA
jgi:acyl-[acyl-carrier-protein]-phospholipid O-acyltransferase / long-chain-fatty-acid--[acyl-carrier-protein] ligase